MKNKHDVRHFASPLRLLIITAVSIFFAEMLIMFIISHLPPLSVPAEALLDSLLLVIPVFPILYIFLFRPMILHIAQRREIEQKLEESYNELEMRVRKRTADLANANESLQAEITERKRTEETLMKNRASLMEAQRIAHLGNWDWDIVNNTLDWSDEIYRIFGLSPNQFDATYEAFLNSVHPDDRELVKDAVSKTLNENKPYSIDHRIVRPDGSVLIVHEQAGVKLNEAGKPIRMIGTVQDVTEPRKMEQELMKAHKLESIGILAGGIAHDFNNLLTVVLGNISIAKRPINPDDSLYKRLTEAEKALQRAQGLTQQLLTFSKGGAPVKETSSITESIAGSANFALRGSKVRCEYSIDENIWPVEIDSGQINQVVHNLIINAEQAMPDGGVINVQCENITADEDTLALKKGRYVKLSVRDNGIGIPEENLNKIFDPYFTTKEHGSGLGLAISYSIIKKHDGLITVESKPGKGTTFHIYLPASDKKITKSRKSEEKLYAGKGKILVMDDEALIRELLNELLSHIGYAVEFAKDGSEAIEKYRKAVESGCPFDAVIMDLTIPGGMGGKEAIKQLLEIDPNTTAIVSSGYSNDPIMAEYKNYGFKGVVAKPYDLKKLSNILHNVIKETV